MTLRSDQQSGREVTLGQQLLGWAVVMGVAALNYGLSLVPLGEAALPVQLALATANLVVITWWFMHLAEQKGTRRFALPVGIGFLLLLLAITLLDVATRYPPANPNAIREAAPPHRPMPSRTEPPGGPWPHRLPGE